ncbi:MAG: YbaK/EbsC family protein [Synergistaceae bacterium]|nr:YbaK/EbsC family protein [Synergistaceae bacterium]
MTKNSSRSPKEFDPVERVRSFLRERGHSDAVTVTEETIFTVEDASLAVGAPPAHILKSLVFIADERPVLALMSGVNKVNPKKVRDACGAKKIKMADPEYVFKWSGYKVGGVPPVGYPEDVPVYLDEDIFQYPTVWAAAGSEHAFFPVAPEALLEMTGGTKYGIKK